MDPTMNNVGADGGNESVGDGAGVAQSLPNREELVWPPTPRPRNDLPLPAPDNPNVGFASEEYMGDVDLLPVPGLNTIGASPSLHRNNALGLHPLSPLEELDHLPQLPVNNEDDGLIAIAWDDVFDELTGAWLAVRPVLWIIPLLLMMFELVRVLFAGFVPRFCLP